MAHALARTDARCKQNGLFSLHALREAQKVSFIGYIDH